MTFEKVQRIRQMATTIGLSLVEPTLTSREIVASALTPQPENLLLKSAGLGLSCFLV